MLNKLVLYSLGLGLTNKVSYSVADRLLGFLILVPPIFLILTPINAASAAVLSINGFPTWTKAIVGLLSVALAGWGVNTLNHYIDRERDKSIWPDRAIPSGRVKPQTALISALILLACSLLLSWYYFNSLNFVILLLAIVLSSAYSMYFRDKVGYLSLPPIPGLIYLGAWAAFTPETIFTSLTPWYLFLMGLIWQAAHITIYYPLHTYRQVDTKLIKNETPLFITRPTAKTAAVIGLCLMFATLTLSILLPFLVRLSYVYIMLVFLSGIYAFICCLRNVKKSSSRHDGFKAFASLSIFRLTISLAIILDIYILYY